MTDNPEELNGYLNQSSKAVSSNEYELTIGHKLYDYGIRGEDNTYLTKYILAYANKAREEGYKKGYIDGGIATHLGWK